MAIILFLIVLIFLVCHTPKNIVNIYEGIKTIGNMTNTDTSQQSQIFIPILVTFSHLLLTINSSINILIYLAKVTTTNKQQIYFILSIQDKTFRKKFKKVTKGFHGKSKNTNLQVEESTKNTQKQNLKAEKYYHMSKSLSLDSNYSRLTSLFGFGSRQSSLETNPGNDDGKVVTRVNQEECLEYSNNLQGEQKSSLLKRADAIDEVSPALERWTPPDIIVHTPEETPAFSCKEQKTCVKNTTYFLLIRESN